MPDTLRDRIAAAIYDSSDEYSRKLMVRPDCPGASEMDGDGKPVCYVWADAVTDLLIDMAGQSELLKAIDRMHR